MRKRIETIALNGVIIAILCLLLAIAGTWQRMSAQFDLGEKAFKKGDFIGAVAGYEAALHMYIPSHPTMEKAARQLWILGETSERQGDVNRALIAYRALRSSFYAAKWLTTPGQKWISKCDEKIAALTPLQVTR